MTTALEEVGFRVQRLGVETVDQCRPLLCKLLLRAAQTFPSLEILLGSLFFNQGGIGERQRRAVNLAVGVEGHLLEEDEVCGHSLDR